MRLADLVSRADEVAATASRNAKIEALAALLRRATEAGEAAVAARQRSSRHRGGVALRFARVLRYRSDKAADETDTIDSVRALMSR